MGWIGVDFDGTLADYLPSQGNQLGRPLAPMVQQIKTWLSAGKEVRIFTARAETPSGVSAVQHWLLAHGLPKLAVTNVKDSQMTALWDDKAIRVIKNTGKPCYACAGVNCFSAQEGKVLTDC
ncbi:hypothetical protein [Candidatus Regiella endosymbiont of Tuberolachnus salignus]|uniref:hypothetical protein n=1 Tax=Candidatus Regiella endosymbiont of Tuberolachnus salignus TaxID=3077956 RepID=UPI0030D06ED8